MNLFLQILIISVISAQAYSQLCPNVQISCDPFNRYSAFDGSCNNLRTPWFGKATSPYKRYLRAEYQDGTNSPRTLSVTGRPLPNPRV